MGKGEEGSILEHSGEGDEGVAVGAAESAGAAHNGHLVGTGRPDSSGDHECPIVLSAIGILQHHGLDAAGHAREVTCLDGVAAAIPELPRGWAHGLGDIEREEGGRAEVRGEGGVERWQKRVRSAQCAVHLDVHEVLEHERLVRRLARLGRPGTSSPAKEQCDHKERVRDEGSCTACINDVGRRGPCQSIHRWSLLIILEVMPSQLKRNVLFVNLFIFGSTKIYGYMLVGIICIN